MILYALIYTWLFYGAFLIYCAVHAAKRSGAFERAPRVVQWTAYSYVLPAYVADVFFNLFPLLGPLLFLEPPWAHVEWSGSGVTFTHRCHWHKLAGSGWRQRLGAWICNRGLAPFDPGHC